MTRVIRNWTFVALLLVIGTSSTPLQAGCVEGIQQGVGFSFTACGNNCDEQEDRCGEVCSGQVSNFECQLLIDGKTEGECDCTPT
jgi:hypothetical protein